MAKCGEEGVGEFDGEGTERDECWWTGRRTRKSGKCQEGVAPTARRAAEDRVAGFCPRTTAQ